MKKIFSKKYIFYYIVVIVVILAALLPFILEKNSEESEIKASILDAEAEVGSISKTLSGTGTLTSEDTYDISVADGVKILKILVSDGQIVSEGDALATVNKTSVLTAINSICETLSDIEDEMNDADDEQQSNYVTTSVSGTITKLYASKYDDVEKVMNEYGCLGIITIDDTGDELPIVAITGTVCAVYYNEGDHVYSGATLFYLSDVGFAAEYESLLALHNEYEDLVSELFEIYEDGYIKAPCDGYVSNVDTSLETKAVFADNAAYNGEYPRNEQFLITATAENTYDPKIDTNFMWKFQDPVDDNPDFHLISYKGTISEGDLIVVYAYKENDDVNTETVYTVYNVTNPYSEEEKKEEQQQQQQQSGGQSMSGAGGGMTQVQSTEETTEYFSLEKTTVMNITPMDEMTISITLDELDVLNVKVGQTAQITIDALPGRAFEGTVESINTSGSNSGGNSKYSAVVKVKYDESMLPGMNASTLITISTKDNIITVPVEALYETENGTIVYTSYDEKNETLLNPVEVETGISDGINTEISNGISQGQSVYYEYYDKISIEGMEDQKMPTP